MQPVKGEEEKEGEGRRQRLRHTDEYNQHLSKEVGSEKIVIQWNLSLSMRTLLN